ncbi:MAG: glycosyltransferase family 9 protein [Thermoleophilia bacterium]|nr:glycosyltransferase family 9 protein [Thermoleophilia bacterium]
MPAHPLEGLAPRRVAIVRALLLGDMLCATPALRAFRAGLPEAQITLVGLPWARELAGRLPHLVDDYLALPGFPGLPESEPRIRELPAFLAEAQSRCFDLAVQLHGSGRVSNVLTALLGASRVAAFATRDAFRPDPELTFPYPAHGHEIHRLLALPRALGLEPQGDELEFPVRAEDEAELRSAAPDLASRAYACIHPGARSARPWPPDRFAAVADTLAARGLRIVLTGTAAEARVTRAVASAMRRHALDLAGRTSLGALGALVAGGRLLVSNDTGTAHLAAALRTPSVVVVTTSDPERWCPLDGELHRVVVRPDRPGPVVAAADALLGVPA